MLHLKFYKVPILLCLGKLGSIKFGTYFSVCVCVMVDIVYIDLSQNETKIEPCC